MLNTILDGDGKLVDQYPPTMMPLPALEFIRELQRAVVHSEDNAQSVPAALGILQKRVLMAIARFECEMGGVL